MVKKDLWGYLPSTQGEENEQKQLKPVWAEGWTLQDSESEVSQAALGRKAPCAHSCTEQRDGAQPQCALAHLMCENVDGKVKSKQRVEAL